MEITNLFKRSPSISVFSSTHCSVLIAVPFCAGEVDNSAMAGKGTVVFDVGGLFPGGEQPFVVNGRKYVCMVSEFTDTVIHGPDGSFVCVEPAWSQDVVGGPMSLDLLTVKEVVADEIATKKTDAQPLVRILACMGRSSTDKPEKIELLPIPDKFKEAYNYIFPNDLTLQCCTARAWELLDGYKKCHPLVDVESDQTQSCKRKRGQDEAQQTEEQGENNKKQKRNETNSEVSL